ncbi:MAG: hypothetical protein ACLF0P_11965 [Thermoanaerobaculia bacterium]
MGPLRAGLDAWIAEEDWENAAISAGNLSELTLTLGDVAGALEAAEESVELADRSGDAFQRMARRTTLADALHHAGRWGEAETLFREAEAMQAERQSRYPRLYSVQGYQYCDLLLSRGEPEDGEGLEGVGEGYRAACEEIRDRAEMTLVWAEEAEASVLTIALDYLSLGRAHLGLALTAPGEAPDFHAASEPLDRAVDGLREAGQEDELPRGLLARAALRRLSGDPDGAAADLREAQEIAERGSMRLFEADAHLEWTRLHLGLGTGAGDRDAAREHLHRARELVRECGYGRREREVAWLEGRLAEGS